jgi:hypothetical protein
MSRSVNVDRGITAAPPEMSADFAAISYLGFDEIGRAAVHLRRSSRYDESMERDLDQKRQQAHALLNMLPAEELNAVGNLLEVIVQPLARSLAMAPVEEEEITLQTAAALDRARASLDRGERISHEEVLREFELSR